MEYILGELLSFLLLYKYVGLFTVSFLAAFILPVPSSSILAAAGAFASQGYFSITTVLVVAFLGNITGDNLGYFLARVYGLSFMRTIGFGKLITSKLYTTLTIYLQHFSYALIFCSRFITTVGPLVNILSGITGIRYLQFFTLGFLGEIAYVLLYGMLGYFLGNEWENNLSFIFEATGIILSLGLLLGGIQYMFFKKMKNNSSIIKKEH
jgi:membrane protein DedA with SNARE-associated domain